MIQGNDCVFALKIGETYEAVYCATSFSFNQTTNEIESTVNSDGRFRDFTYNTFSYSLTLDGLAKLGTVNSSFDVLIAQGGFITLPYRLIFEEDSSVRTIEGECIVVTSAFTGQADQGLEFSHTFQGKGSFNAFVDGEPNDGGEIPEDGGDGGGGPGTGGEDSSCDVIINNDILDIIIAPNAPLSYNYRVQLNDIVGTWSYIAWRLDGGPWHYETSQEFLLPFLENGSYTLELAAVCPNGVFGDSVNLTLDVFNEEPAACDGTIDSWSYTSSDNDDGTITVTFTVNASSPTETLNNIQYKLDGGYDAGVWITTPLTDDVATFSVVLPSLDFSIDLRTVCSNGGFGFSVEDGGEIPEPVTCSVSIEILSYYLSYAYNNYACQAVMTYALTGSTLDSVYQIEWFNPQGHAWENVADSTDPVIIIDVVPGTIIQQQFRVACDSTHFGPVFTIPVTVPIKGLQLDSRVINYTTTDEYYHVYVNGTQISEGGVEHNNYTEFNYVGLLNTPVTIKITLGGLPDPAKMLFITRGYELNGIIDPSDEHSVLFEDVYVTYGFAIVFWDFVVVETCDTIVDFTDYSLTYDDVANNWVIMPIYTVTANTDPTAIIEYWNGSIWQELGDADSFEPLTFTMPDNTTTEIKLRAKCSEGSFGAESALSVTTPEHASWTPTNQGSVVNYSDVEQVITITQNGVTVFSETVPPRTSVPMHLDSWDAGDEWVITTSPGYPRIPSDTPDPTQTWYTQIWEGDNYIGSYSHDTGDSHSVVVNGAGVDLSNGFVFAIQATDTPITLYVVESVDYTFDPDSGAFEGFPVLNSGTEWYQYSTDGGTTWILHNYTVPISVTAATDDEIWVRGTDAGETTFGDTVIITVEACPLILSDVTPLLLGYNATGTPDWTVVFMYTVSDYDGLDTIQFYSGGTWYDFDVVGFGDNRALAITFEYYGANDQTIVQEFRTKCADGKLGETVSVNIAFPDFFSWTPTNNSAILNYGTTTETYEIFVDGVSVASGTTSPLETGEVFDFSGAEPAGLSTVKITLGTSTPDPTHFLLANAYGYTYGTYGATVDPLDSHSIIFDNIDFRDPVGSNVRGMIITFWQ